jgi:hypothetical protein
MLVVSDIHVSNPCEPSIATDLAHDETDAQEQSALPKTVSPHI